MPSPRSTISPTGAPSVGLGAGWAQNEYEAYGFDFPSAGARLDLLDEFAQVIRSLLRNEVTDFAGQHFRLTDARCEPKPLQAELPIWIGGGGERRTLRLVAEHADGWNVPFVSPEEMRRKTDVLEGHCADVGRDPGTIRRAVNVGLVEDEAALRKQFGGIAEFVRPGVLMGEPEALAERMTAYIEAGAHQINIALRAPWDPGGLERVAEAVEQVRKAQS